MNKWQGWRDSINESEIKVYIPLSMFMKECGLTLLWGKETQQICLSTANVNRPGLLFAGFGDYFAASRVQVLGNAETYFLSGLAPKRREAAVEDLLRRKVPCVIVSRGIKPDDYFIETAEKYQVPVFLTDKPTTILTNELTAYFNRKLAETISIHGVLMDVSGVGVLLTGNSGMGKSETALELIHRGHKLVADDAVHVKKISSALVGSAPEKIKHFMEVRGIGIIDVSAMFGVGSVLSEKEIELVIQLEHWTQENAYDRLGTSEFSETILGISVPKLIFPVMPGRNLAIIAEVAARNYRLKKSGYDAVDALIRNQNFKN